MSIDTLGVTPFQKRQLFHRFYLRGYETLHISIPYASFYMLLQSSRCCLVERVTVSLELVIARMCSCKTLVGVARETINPKLVLSSA